MKSRSRVPRTITLASYAASRRAVRQMNRDGLLPDDTKLRSARYQNNLIEQDHRHIKSRIDVMLGFKRVKDACVLIAGIELMHRIRKGQFKPPLAATRSLNRCVDSMECGALRLISGPVNSPLLLCSSICTTACLSMPRFYLIFIIAQCSQL